MKDEFDPQALAELIDAINYLDRKVTGLGGALYDEVNHAIEVIKEQPDRWPVLDEGVRRYRLRRFRYFLVYRILGDAISIIAVMHTSRHPGYWLDRLR